MREMRISGSGRIGACPRPSVKLSGGVDIAMGGAGEKRGDGTATRRVFVSHSLACTTLAVLAAAGFDTRLKRGLMPNHLSERGSLTVQFTTRLADCRVSVFFFF